jgi:hypothetical protein
LTVLVVAATFVAASFQVGPMAVQHSAIDSAIQLRLKEAVLERKHEKDYQEEKNAQATMAQNLGSGRPSSIYSSRGMPPITSWPATLVQITDLHTASNPTLAPSPQFSSLFTAIVRMVLDDALHKYPKLDRLLVTGDLVDRGNKDPLAYVNLRRELEERGILNRTLIIAGNHDNRENLCAVFPDSCSAEGKPQTFFADSEPNNQTFFAESLKRPDGGNAWRLIGLDSRDRLLHEDQLRRVEAEFNEAGLAGTPTLMFMHHPPVKVGSYWDPTRLTNTNELIAVLHADSGSPRRLRAIFCGHVHWEGEAELGGLTKDESAPVPVYATPATSRQFGPSVEDPSRAEWLSRYHYRDYRTGYRVIELGIDGTMTTSYNELQHATSSGIACRPSKLEKDETFDVIQQLKLLDPCGALEPNGNLG